MKRTWADKWSPEVLEQIASSCNVASSAQTEDDWEFFLNAVYDVASSLPRDQRAIILLSQEHGLSFSDIGRALSMPFNTVRRNFVHAIEKMVKALKHRSLLDTKLRRTKVGKEYYIEGAHLEEHDETSRIGFYHGREPPWFGDCPNPLIEEGETA